MSAQFNCNIMIVNNSSQTLTFSSKTNKHGHYSIDPPNTISAGATANFQMVPASISFVGTEGTCEYSCFDGNTKIKFSYECPMVSSNSADACLTQGTGITVHKIPNPLPKSGHPVNVQFTLSS